MAIHGEKVEAVTYFIFLGYKNTAVNKVMKLKDAMAPCGPAKKKKRFLLLEGKAMTNLESILKSRDITLPTKLHIVKLWFFQ